MVLQRVLGTLWGTTTKYYLMYIYTVLITHPFALIFIRSDKMYLYILVKILRVSLASRKTTLSLVITGEVTFGYSKAIKPHQWAKGKFRNMNYFVNK